MLRGACPAGEGGGPCSGQERGAGSWKSGRWASYTAGNDLQAAVGGGEGSPKFTIGRGRMDHRYLRAML